MLERFHSVETFHLISETVLLIDVMNFYNSDWQHLYNFLNDGRRRRGILWERPKIRLNFILFYRKMLGQDAQHILLILCQII